MRLLLDTHAFLWMSLDDPKLVEGAKHLLADPANDLYLSPASYWEIAIKISIGSYALAEPLDVFVNREIERNGLAIVPISIGHAAIVSQLPFHHRDPFDRMIIAQALSEEFTIVGKDEVFDQYKVKRVWKEPC
jgi:PIN domain nuclease of toxin-antitoxin system